MKKLITSFLVLLLVVPNGYAVTGVPDSRHWVQAGYSAGGAFPMVIPDHFVPNKIYAIPDVNAPYVSTNKGESWSFLSSIGSPSSGFNGSQIGTFIQSKNDPSLMFTGDTYTYGAGVSRSIDGGQKWKKVANYRSSKSDQIIALDPNNDNTVYTSFSGDVYRSLDKGDTWTKYITLPFDSRAAAYTTSGTCSAAQGGWVNNKCVFGIRFIYVDDVNNDLWLGSKSKGMVRYDMDTDTQSYVDLVGTNALYNVMYKTFVDGSSVENFCVTAGYKIACTADFSSWDYTAAVTTGSTYYISAFAVTRNSDDSKTFVVSRRAISNFYSTAQHYSNNSGSSWSTATFSNNPTMNPNAYIFAGNQPIMYIESDPFNQNVFYASTDGRVFRSDNAGASFAEKDLGAQNSVAQEMIVAPNGREFQFNMDTGIQYSDNNGDSWIQAVPNTSMGYPAITGSVNDFGGHYWRGVTLGTKEEWNAGTGVVVATATTYSGIDALYYVNWVVRSEDSGVHWTKNHTGLPGVGMYGDTVWDHGYARSLAKSADESVIYLGIDGGSCDADGAGGNPPNCTTNVVYGGLFKSLDKGITWSRVWSNPSKIYRGLAVDPKDPTSQKLLFGEFAGGQNPAWYALYQKTGASTANWVNDGTGPNAFTLDVAYDSDGHPYAVSSGPTIYKSVVTSYGDGTGSYGTWRPMHTFSGNGNLSGLKIDPNNKNRIFVSIYAGDVKDRKVYVTIDAKNHTSANWYDITGDLGVVGGCNSLQLNPEEGTQGFLYCASNGAGMWKLDLADSPTTQEGRMCVGCSS